jgi:hypothetical protein
MSISDETRSLAPSPFGSIGIYTSPKPVFLVLSPPRFLGERVREKRLASAVGETPHPNPLPEEGEGTKAVNQGYGGRLEK